MAKGEIIPFRRDDGAQGLVRKPTSPPSLRSAAGEPVIQFPGSAAASSGDQEGAGASPASVPSFDQLGDLAHAVVLRLQSKFPRIVVRGVEGGEPPLS